MAGTTPQPQTHEHFHHAPEPTLLERQLAQGRSALEKYSKQILAGSLVLVLVVVGAILWHRSGVSRNTAAWTAFLECRAPEDFIQLADKYPKAPVGHWARLEGAKQFLQQGLARALTDRATSESALTNAKEAYQKILNDKSVSQEIRQEALYGLATVLEATSDGDTKPAIDAYEALLKEFPNSPHRLWAESRVKDLKTENAASFYAWFSKQNPKPTDRSGPKDIPALNSLLPDLNIEGGDEATNPDNGEKAPDLPADAAMPAKESNVPAGEFPADAPKADSAKPESTPAPEMPEQAKSEKPADEVKTEAPKGEAATETPKAEPAPEAPSAGTPPESPAPDSKPE